MSLPVIYGFNNSSGNTDWNVGYAMAEDGTVLVSHISSSEGFMRYDLGIYPGGFDRSEIFRKHYPDGYRCEFVSGKDVKAHAGLVEACERNHQAQEAKP